MTQQELKQFIFELTNTMAKKQSYIKGYGKDFRVMDKDHNPLTNISKQQMDVLKFNGVVFQDNLVFRPNDFNPPFKHAVDVKLPTKADLVE